MSEVKTVISKPFLKWVGGKTQIIHILLNKFPKEINNYHELFLGGGSVLFGLLSLIKDNKITLKGKIFAYDINQILIYVYKNIQTKKDNLFTLINKYTEKYNNIKELNVKDKKERNPLNESEALKYQESYYYWLRNKFNQIKNKKSCEASALLLVINKTCFRGLYREGPNGFNVPFGNYKNKLIVITKEKLDTISDLIKDVVFKCSDYKVSFNKIKPDDFVYLDPPYAPENKTSFVNYNKDGFNLKEHLNLFKLTNGLKEKNIKFIMSNVKCKLIEDNFKIDNEQIYIEEIKARRAINSKNPEAKTTEVIISNFNE